MNENTDFFLLSNTGKYFYELDETSAMPGYPKLIREVWGIEGPIDAAFTRINCEGKTYVFQVGLALGREPFRSSIPGSWEIESILGECGCCLPRPSLLVQR